ncbi:DUF1275 domain-containing protein [Salmonella enterica]|nr:DUF1275 domain-containing protein [Salmonella enterica]
MLITLKRPRRHGEDRWMALWLATTAGLLNSTALVAFGLFPAHMTGNTSWLSSEVSGTDTRDIFFFGSVLISFLSGSVVTRITAIWGRIRKYRTVFCQILLMEGLLLTSISLYEIFEHSLSSNRTVILILCFLMGIHNSVSTQLSNGRVRTTHLTGTLTDTGITFATLFAAMLRRDCSGDNLILRNQLVTQLIIIFSFLSGGIAGIILFKWSGFKSVACVGLILTGVAASSIILVKTRISSRR